MRNRFAGFIVVALILFGGINYYVGLRGWQWLQVAAPVPVSGWVYWPLLLAVSYAFFVARFGDRFFSRQTLDVMTVIGGYWLSIWTQLLPMLLIIDLVRLLNCLFGFVSAAKAAELRLVPITGDAVALLLGLYLIYGIWRARHPVVVHYEVDVAKPAISRRELTIALVSDTHFGALMATGRLRRMVQMVNATDPDLVLIAGDLIDDDLGPFIARDMPLELRKLKSKLGTYAVLGNHDSHGGELTAFRHQMKKARITLLVDETVKIDDSLYLIGRDDVSGKAYSGQARKPLADLLSGVDRTLPLIVMDHQPSHLEEAQQAAIDLQVSGHTHRGQFFPYNYVTRKVFEVDWGYLYKEGLHVIVSLGFGTWGPPIRIGNRPEVVTIRMRLGG